MGDTSSWLPEEVLGATREAPEAERDAPEDWDVPGLAPRESANEVSPASSEQGAEAADPEVAKDSEDAPTGVATAVEEGASAPGTPAELAVQIEAITARFDRMITGGQERLERELDQRHQELAARSTAGIEEVRSDVGVLQAEVGEVRARLDAAAEKAAERRRRSAQESGTLAADLREEEAKARDLFESLVSESRDELRKAHETFDRRQRKVLGAFAKRLEAVEAGISTLIADAESTHALLSVLSHRRGAAADPEVRSGPLSLNTATFEELRNLGFSATQATRVLTYRDAHSFDSVEQITELPGLPDKLSQSLKARLTV